jgi:hypothetical protein
LRACSFIGAHRKRDSRNPPRPPHSASRPRRRRPGTCRRCPRSAAPGLRQRPCARSNAACKRLQLGPLASESGGLEPGNAPVTRTSRSAASPQRCRWKHLTRLRTDVQRVARRTGWPRRALGSRFKPTAPAGIRIARQGTDCGTRSGGRARGGRDAPVPLPLRP